MTETKSFRAEIKSSDATTGVVEALVSVFGNIDYGGDRVVKGAFAASLAEWKASGDPIPFIWAHSWNDPNAHIGVITDAKETDEGLYVKAQLDVGRPFADQVLHLLKQRRVKEFSFGYEIEDFATVDEDGQKVRELTQLGIIEAGPCLMGMNDATRLISAASRDHEVKAADVPAGIKTIIGSLEALKDRVRDALREAYPGGYPYVRGIFDDGGSGVVIYDAYLYANDDWKYASFQESFTDDGSVVTLAGDAVEVSVMEVVVPAAGEKAASGDTAPTISPERKQRAFELLLNATTKH